MALYAGILAINNRYLGAVGKSDPQNAGSLVYADIAYQGAVHGASEIGPGSSVVVRHIPLVVLNLENRGDAGGATAFSRHREIDGALVRESKRADAFAIVCIADNSLARIEFRKERLVGGQLPHRRLQIGDSEFIFCQRLPNIDASAARQQQDCHRQQH